MMFLVHVLLDRYIYMFLKQENDGHYWVSGRTQEEALEKAVKRFAMSPEKIILKQGTVHV